MNDWHCHLLPGLDDGARSLDEALLMARQLAGAGFTEVYCTPHCIRGTYDNTPQTVRRGVLELQSALDGEDIPLRLHPGMEYYLDEYFPEALDDPQPLGGTSLLLVEAPSRAEPALVRENIHRAVRCGFTPLLAHPERTLFFDQAPPGDLSWTRIGRALRFFSPPPSPVATELSPDSELGYLRDMGCLFQGNLGSFAGVYGARVRRRAAALHGSGIYHCFGSDGHSPDSLEKVLEGLKAL
ncbi:Tyrosine-protein phosphatase YwqE [Desulfuromonas soudanensis]|uniref:protein-tyrosine-phosphatase n=1 Tax=Desulfuromonas soudanensis TaxID=1603606 RepID=A0A0M4D1R3_9BACT|nr:CpsB/CapC family capsule biosynthesis tyrosine phosphatase [Desulfuromonas soudanensis]ALC17052.1 Tyrosine-protein phosphatase YwqE [Desulfuromonas soudanensis]